MAIVTSFVGIDQDAIGNGDDDETLPVDTWLQNRIALNNANLLAPRVGYTWSPIIGSGGTFTSYTGIRPICGFDWSTRWKASVWLYPGQTGIDVTLAYQADTPGNTTQAGTVEVKIACGDGSEAVETLASTYSSGIKTGHQTIRLTFNEPVRVAGAYEVAVSFRSKSTSYVPTTIGDSTDGSTANLRHQAPFRLVDTDSTADKYFTPNSSGSHPDGDSLEAMWILTDAHSDWEVAGGRNLDLLWTDDTTSGGSIAGTVQAVLPPAAAATAGGGTAFMHVCLMLRSVHVAPVFPLVFQTSDMQGRYAPIQEFGAAEAMIQAQDAIRAYKQPAVALIGPRGRVVDTALGEDDLDAFAVNGYPVCWPSVMGDYVDPVVTSGRFIDLINEGFFLRTENPILELECRWICIHHGAAFNQNQFEADPEARTKDRKAKRVVTDTGGAGSATWNVSASVHQLDDAASGTGSWTTDITEYGSLTESLRVPVFGANVADSSPDQPPVLRGADSIVHTGKSGVTYPGFWFKEGQLFDGGQEVNPDHQVVYISRHTITLTGLTQTQTLLPFRLYLKATLDEYTDPVKVGAGVSDGDLRLMLVAFSLIEHPQDP